ncbi:MAG TPA: hypothetical protein VFO64_00635 [Gaiellaceae bacterium]|jgi:hypothetical protein|nr:hypothetical protein [Gaiellaceae bacterium]
MFWGERTARRRALVGLLVAFVVLDAALAFVVLTDGPGQAARAAAPLHPVVNGFKPDGTRLTECADAGCFQQAFGNVAYREGPKAALRLVEEVYGRGEDPACHRVTHIIGAASLARFGGNVTKTLGEGDATCWSGYYHGVLERSLVKVRSRQPAALARASRTLCSDRRLTPWVVYGCLHGLGHGLMIATGLNLPVSLEVCSRLDRWWDRDACRGGAFMENLQSSYGYTSTFLKDADPVYPCNWVPVGEKRRCYQIVTSRILGAVGDSWERTAEICSDVEPAFVSWCFRSFGRDVSSRTGRDSSEIAGLCAIARDYDHEAECVEAAAYDVTANFTSGERGAELCAALHSGVQEACFYGVGIVLGRFAMTSRERIADCRELSDRPALVDACVRGGRENLPRT